MKGLPRRGHGAVLSLHRPEPFDFAQDRLVEGSKGGSLFCFPLGLGGCEGCAGIISRVGRERKE
jgi:hypothetical protein